ncbi:hypothetical protein KK449_17510 [Clostridioides difficile]|nr:hypothetical protein [Clostridioides difficile]
MVLENKWYEADTVQDSIFLLTCKADQGKNRLVSKIYYQMEKGLLHIRCEITLGNIKTSFYG